VLKVLARDAGPVIRHAAQDFPRVSLDPDLNGLRTRLERVARQIRKNLGDAVAVTFDRVARADHVHMNARAALGGQRLKRLDDVADERGDILRPASDRKSSGMDLSDISQVSDEPSHVLR